MPIDLFFNYQNKNSTGTVIFPILFLYLGSVTIYKINISMIGVNVKDNESIDRAINRFKKMVTRSRVLNEYKERQQFTKPSEERREALKKSVREERRRQRDNY